MALQFSLEDAFRNLEVHSNSKKSDNGSTSDQAAAPSPPHLIAH